MPKFSVEMTQYQGPLEVLLDLIEERKMSISDVSLAEVCDSYLAYLEKLPSLPLSETSQFILIASALLLIKSRSLLPMLELSSEERESVEELERRLAKYKIIREATKLLRREWGKAPLLFPLHAPERDPIFTPGKINIAGIKDAALRILSILPNLEKLARAAVQPVLALEEVIIRVEKRVAATIRARFSELTKSKGRDEVIVYFLALLELVRSGSLSATQERLFSDITLETESLVLPKYGAQ
ncbi:MAG TPA: ScpA family protein [Candidatus Paceibacterota bacterium]